MERLREEIDKVNSKTNTVMATLNKQREMLNSTNRRIDQEKDKQRYLKIS